MEPITRELECLYPNTAEEAVRQLAERPRGVLVVAGGTSAALTRPEKYRALMDITRMGLNRLERSERGWELGCNLRVQELARSAELAGWCDGVVREAALSVASRPLRNMITVGGNAVAVFRWSDLPALWLAAGARFELLSPAGKRLLEADHFYAVHPRQTLAPEELLVRIILPGLEGWSGTFIKLARTAFDFSIVDVAALLRLEEGKIADLRLAVAGTSTLPWRAQEAERRLRGKKPQLGAIEEAAADTAAQAKVMADVRTSEDYRRRMLREILVRAVVQAVERAGGKVRP